MSDPPTAATHNRRVVGFDAAIDFREVEARADGGLMAWTGFVLDSSVNDGMPIPLAGNVHGWGSRAWQFLSSRGRLWLPHLP